MPDRGVSNATSVKPDHLVSEASALRWQWVLAGVFAVGSSCPADGHR